MSVEACTWCAEPASTLVPSEAARKITHHGRPVAATMGRWLPACEACARKVVRRSPQFRAAVAEARKRYWDRRQEQLF